MHKNAFAIECNMYGIHDSLTRSHERILVHKAYGWKFLVVYFKLYCSFFIELSLNKQCNGRTQCTELSKIDRIYFLLLVVVARNIF